MEDTAIKQWKLKSQLLVAIQNNDVVKASKLIQNKKVDPDTKFSINSHKRPGVCLCVENNNVDMVQLLVGYGASVNQTDSNGQSPLHICCEFGYAGIAILLIKNRGDVFSKNTAGQTPLHLAAKCGKIDLVKLLIEHGADLEAVDELGRTPLHYASSTNTSRIVPFLINCGANAKRIDKLGNTAMHFAVESVGADLGSIVYLTKAYPWAATKLNYEKKTPLHILACANRKDEEEALRLILGGLSFSSSVRPPKALSPRTTRGHTPLHVAVLEKRVDLVRLLIASGAEVDTCDQLGRSPLDCAARDMDWAIVALLLESGATNKNLISEGEVLPHIRDDSMVNKFISAMRPMSLKSSCRRTICRTWGFSIQDTDKCPNLYKKYLSYLEL